MPNYVAGGCTKCRCRSLAGPRIKRLLASAVIVLNFRYIVDAALFKGISLRALCRILLHENSLLIVRFFLEVFSLSVEEQDASARMRPYAILGWLKGMTVILQFCSAAARMAAFMELWSFTHAHFSPGDRLPGPGRHRCQSQ